jgi:hypothetical protein
MIEADLNRAAPFERYAARAGDGSPAARALASVVESGHTDKMADRPCTPDRDTKRLWQIFLPDTPFPACGDPRARDSVADEAVASSARSAHRTVSPRDRHSKAAMLARAFAVLRAMKIIGQERQGTGGKAAAVADSTARKP